MYLSFLYILFFDRCGDDWSTGYYLIINQKDKDEAFIKYKSLERKQERFLRHLEKKLNPEKRILIKIIKFLIDRYGFDDSFSYQDLIDGLGIDLETAEEIIAILHNDLKIISKFSSDTDTKLPTFILNKSEDGINLDYT